MQKITLYRYVRPDGGVTVSTQKPDVDCTELCRLVADEGMTLTDGNSQAQCVDTYNPDRWAETELDQNALIDELIARLME